MRYICTDENEQDFNGAIVALNLARPACQNDPQVLRAYELLSAAMFREFLVLTSGARLMRLILTLLSHRASTCFNSTIVFNVDD